MVYIVEKCDFLKWGYLSLTSSVQEVHVIFKWNNLQSLGKVMLHLKNMNFVYPMFHSICKVTD